MLYYFGVKDQSIYVDILVIFLAAEHLFFLIKVVLRIYIRNKVVIINGKSPAERQFTRDEHRKDYQRLLDHRRKAYLAVQ